MRNRARQSLGPPVTTVETSRDTAALSTWPERPKAWTARCSRFSTRWRPRQLTTYVAARRVLSVCTQAHVPHLIVHAVAASFAQLRRRHAMADLCHNSCRGNDSSSCTHDRDCGGRRSNVGRRCEPQLSSSLCLATDNVEPSIRAG